MNDLGGGVERNRGFYYLHYRKDIVLRNRDMS